MSLIGNTVRKRIPQLAKREGNFLEAVLPVKAFVTLTSPRQLQKWHLEKLWHAWVRGLQRQHRMSLGWIKSVEYRPQRHIHAALIAAAPIDCGFAADLWRGLVARRYTQAARVERYQKGCCGLGYVLKKLDTPYEDVRFSENVAAYAPTLMPLFRPNSAQKRQRRRIERELRKMSLRNEQ